jgi:DnaJ-domain-containing protein 1
MDADPRANPFAVLGLEPTFDVDPRRLRAVWLQKAALHHPDAVGVGTESTCANDALRQLSDPLQRAEVMLRLTGAPTVDERALPPGFLLEIMDLRERADEAHGDEQATSELVGEATDRRQAALETIGGVFRAARARPMEAVEALEIRTQLNVVRSFDRMLEQLARERGDA